MLKVYTIYAPCNQGRGPQTVYTQHVRHFHDIDRNNDPIHAMWMDLREDLQQTYDAGDQIICMGDFNEEVDMDGV